MSREQFIQMFGERAMARGTASIVSALRRHGPLSRRDLQKKAHHRHVSGDAFAACLTLLLENESVRRISDLYDLHPTNMPTLIQYTPVPDWDKSGRKFIRVTSQQP